MYYIGIDLGTSAVKLLLMQEDGTVVKSVSRDYPLYFPKPAWSEQNPEDWWQATIYGLCELTDGCDKSQIEGISFSGQMHGLVILDQADAVIRPAILWNDTRTDLETDWLNNEIGKDKLSQYTANIAFAGFTAPKLLWLKKNEPDNFRKIAKIMLPKDFLVYRMTGVHATDVSDASGTLLFNVKAKSWSQEMLDLCEIKISQMPQIFESFAPVAPLLPSVAQQLGFPGAVRIIAGAADNPAAAIGTGAVGNGVCNLSLGTSGTILIAGDRFAIDKHNALHAFANADGGYYLMGVILSAASCNKWWQNEIIGTRDYVGEEAKYAKLGENQVYFLPYLMGERSPHNDPHARGVFLGMDMSTTRADMLGAMLEGVAFAFRDCCEIAKSSGMKIERSRITGGGARSGLWKNIMANVLNIEIDVTASEEGPALGAAILAAVGCGAFASVRAATEQIIKVAYTIKPDPAVAELYNQRYAKFAKIYPAVKEIFSIN